MRFVTAGDKATERTTIERLKGVFGPDILPTEDPMDPLDAVGVDQRGRDIAFEIKRRNYSKTRFSTFVLAQVKFDKLRAFHGDAYYVAVWNDGTLYAKVSDFPPLTPVWGGRGVVRPGAANDRELMVEMPRHYFKEIA